MRTHQFASWTRKHSVAWSAAVAVVWLVFSALLIVSIITEDGYVVLHIFTLVAGLVAAFSFTLVAVLTARQKRPADASD